MTEAEFVEAAKQLVAAAVVTDLRRRLADAEARVRELEEEVQQARETWVIKESVEGEGVYTLAICASEQDALEIVRTVEVLRGVSVPDLVPERYVLDTAAFYLAAHVWRTP